MNKIEVVNLVPKFLNFFDLANQNDVGEAERWRLWKEHYNFSGLPPGYDQMARKRLNQTWEDYQDNIVKIKAWTPEQERIERYLEEVKRLLGIDEDIPFAIVFYVGVFDKNAIIARYDEHKSMLCLPIETYLSDVIIAHELTHIVHGKKASIPIRWECPISERMLMEGLALHASKQLVPGRSNEAYIEMGVEKGWLQSCHQHRKEILSGISPYLFDSSSEANEKFTFGSGTTGHTREAYYAGWEFVSSQIEKGITFKQLASIEQKNIPDYVKSHYNFT